jgi:hypothetical protein
LLRRILDERALLFPALFAARTTAASRPTATSWSFWPEVRPERSTSSISETGHDAGDQVR